METLEMNVMYYPCNKGGYGIHLEDLEDTFKTLSYDNFRTWSIENNGHSSRKLYALLKTMQHEGIGMYMLCLLKMGCGT